MSSIANTPRWMGKTQEMIAQVRAAVASGKSVLVVGPSGNTNVRTWAEFKAWQRWFLRRPEQKES